MNIFTFSLPQGSSGMPPMNRWPNNQTMIHSAAIATNVACELSKVSIKHTVMLNAPLRAVCVMNDFNDKRYIKAAIIISSFPLLFSPHGRLICIAIDISFEVYNFQKNCPINFSRLACIAIDIGFKVYNFQKNWPKPPSKSNLTRRLDSSTVENALIILNITDSRAKDLGLIERKRTNFVRQLSERKEKTRSVGFKSDLQLLIDDVNGAAATLRAFAEIPDPPQALVDETKSFAGIDE